MNLINSRRFFRLPLLPFLCAAILLLTNGMWTTARLPFGSKTMFSTSASTGTPLHGHGVAGASAVVAQQQAPVIVSHPQNQTIFSGQSATLNVTASGATPLSYQWYKVLGSLPIAVSGATGSSYTTPPLTTNAVYFVEVSNPFGTVNSNQATVFVSIAGSPPQITTQPQSQTIASGQTATLSVTASGTSPLVYEWYRGSTPSTGTLITGATSNTYTTPALTATTSYCVEVRNSFGIATSAAATITVGASVPLRITGINPASGAAGTTVSVTLTVEGFNLFDPAQVLVTGTGISVRPGTAGGNFISSFFDIASNAPSGPRTVTVTQNGQTSNGVTFSVATTTGTPPTITSQPQSQAISTGQSAFLSVSVAGTAPFTYQWYQGTSGDTSQPISGAVNSGYTVVGLTATTSYWVRVSNNFGSVNSTTATITIVSTVPSLTSISPNSLTTGSQNAVVILNGSNLGTGSVVEVLNNGVLDSTVSVTVQSATATRLSTTFTVSSASPVGPRQIRVRKTNGVSNSIGFTVGPWIASITPTSALQGKTVSVSLSGNNLSGSTVQVYRNGQPDTGITSTITSISETLIRTTFVIQIAAPTGLRQVRVVKSTGQASNWVDFTVGAGGSAPVITQHPQNATINSGQTATLNVTASGTAPLAYQWYQGTVPGSGTPISGATASGYTTPPLTANAGYWVRVSNGFGSADSNTASITVTQAATPPSITQQPASTVLQSGQTATLSVVAGGTAPLNYQWYQGTSGVTTAPVGSNSATFTTPPLTASTSFWVRVSNSAGSVNSNTAAVTVNNASPILTALSPNAGQAGAGVSLTITGENLSGGTPEITGNGISITNVVSSATQITASVAIAASATPGVRSVTVRNPGGVVGNALSFSVNPASGGPRIDVLSPSSGKPGFSYRVTFFGNNLGNDPEIIVSGTGIRVRNVAATDGGQLNAIFTIDPTAAEGPRTITVRKANGLTSNPVTFQVANILTRPVIDSVSPDFANLGEQVQVFLAGTFPGSNPAVTVTGAGIIVRTVAPNGNGLLVTLDVSETAFVGFHLIYVTGADGQVSNAEEFAVYDTQPATVTSRSLLMYDETTGLLSGTAETILDELAAEFYDARVTSSVVNQSGGVVVPEQTYTSPGAALFAFADVPASPGQIYTMRSNHCLVATVVLAYPDDTLRYVDYYRYSTAEGPVVEEVEYVLPGFGPSIEIHNPVICLGRTKYDKYIPSVTISPFTAVPKNGQTSVTLTKTGTQTVNVSLTLTTTSGTGEARFANGDSTTLDLSLTEPSTTVMVKGVTESSAAKNIKLEVKNNSPAPTAQNSNVLASQNFSVVQIKVMEVGFQRDYEIWLWAAFPLGTAIDRQDGTVPTWIRGNQDYINTFSKAAYKYDVKPTIFANFTASPVDADGLGPNGIPIAVRVKLKKDGNPILVTKNGLSLNGSTQNGVSTTQIKDLDFTTHPENPSGVKKGVYTFLWEVSYDGGENWVPLNLNESDATLGETGNHIIYWTFDAPIPSPFKDATEGNPPYVGLYDRALEWACGSVAGGVDDPRSIPVTYEPSSDKAIIVARINRGIDYALIYDPAMAVASSAHPLLATSPSFPACLCSDNANLLRGLLQSIGIPAETHYFWGGDRFSTDNKAYIYLWVPTEGLPVDSGSFRIRREKHLDGHVDKDPIFSYHAIVKVLGLTNFYDPSYGIDYPALNFFETVNFNGTFNQDSNADNTKVDKSNWLFPLRIGNAPAATGSTYEYSPRGQAAMALSNTIPSTMSMTTPATVTITMKNMHDPAFGAHTWEVGRHILVVTRANGLGNAFPVALKHSVNAGGSITIDFRTDELVNHLGLSLGNNELQFQMVDRKSANLAFPFGKPLIKTVSVTR